MSVDIIRGDARNLPLEDGSVDLVVTSPPYFALRSYQDGGEHYEGQIGSEPTPAEFLDALIAVTAECVRVLKPSGSIFVNLGDKYSRAGGGGGGSSDGSVGRNGGHRKTHPLAGYKPSSGCVGDDRISPPGRPSTKAVGAPEKSLIGIPWRYALRCIDDLGLILRAEIIWSKPNGLPESVTDRVRRSHEQWFHFTVSPRYFSAVDEIREAHVRTERPWEREGRHPDRSSAAREAGLNHLGDGKPIAFNPLGKLPGSVWTVPTQPLTVPAHLGVDHFAAFPTEWPKRLISGWCPREVCTVCGEGRRPVVDRSEKVLHRPSGAARVGSHMDSASGVHRVRSDVGNVHTVHRITGYACACPDTTAPATSGVVLDPFGGTGTTALVAHALGRHGISVDLSADYCRLAEWRTSDRGELARVLGVAKPPTQLPGQVDLFGEEAS